MNNSHIINFQTFIEQHVSLKPTDFNILSNIFKLKKYKNNTHIIEPIEENNQPLTLTPITLQTTGIPEIDSHYLGVTASIFL